MVKIDLKLNNAYNWIQSEENYFIGHIYYNGKFYYNDEALKLIELNDSNMLDFLKQVDGCFSFVLNSNEKIIIASDLLRVYPVFYRIENNRDIIITDDIMSYSNKKIKEDSIEEIDSMRMCYII